MIAAIALAFAAATAQPEPVLSVPASHALVEGIATDGRTIWVSSVIDRQVLACRVACRTIATLPEGLHPFALAWDGHRKRLWVAADCPPGVPFITACDRGAVLGLDRKGRVRARIAPPTGSFHPGDISASNGELFVSDSQNGAVYRLTARGEALTALLPPGIGKSAQGTALDASRRRLIVADYSQGVAAIDLATGERRLLPRQDGKPLRGLDGVVACGDRFLAVYNGQAPGALVRFSESDSGIQFDEPVAQLDLPDPTQLSVDGDRLLIIANAGWAQAMKGEQRGEPTRIMAVPISGLCTP